MIDQEEQRAKQFEFLKRSITEMKARVEWHAENGCKECALTLKELSK